jgi:hypothetical protein
LVDTILAAAAAGFKMGLPDAYVTPASCTAAATHLLARPNPSVNRHRHGMRLGPRSGFGHHPPHGPSRMPQRASYLER